MAWSISNAMMKAYENSHSSRAQAGASWEASFSDGEPFARSSTTPMPDQYYWPDKTTEHSRLSRFGMTCVPLWGSHGGALLTWYREDFLARTSVQLAKAPDLTENEADSGVRWQGSFARYSPNTSLWKTAQCSLLADSDEYLETWPKWGSMRNGASYLRPIPELSTCVSASGLWQTPVADDAVSRAKGKMNSRGEPKLSAEVKMWPTPTRSDHTGAGHAAQGGLNLRTAAKRWPTATATASKGSSQASLKRKDGSSRESDRLDHAVMASDNGQLNPEWVEWLMGWPIGLTALRPLETDKFHAWQQQHGRF